MLKIIKFVLALLAVILLVNLMSYAQMTYPEWVIVAPNVQAKSNQAVGQSSYDTCAAANGQSTMLCEVARARAIAADNENRFTMFVGDLIYGRVTDPHSLDVYLNYYGLRFMSTVPKPGVLLPFGGGTAVPTLNKNPQVNPTQTSPFGGN